MMLPQCKLKTTMIVKEFTMLHKNLELSYRKETMLVV